MVMSLAFPVPGMEISVFPALSSLLSYPSPAFALSQLVLELCRGDGVANLQTIQSHLDKIHACNAELSPTDQMVGF